MSPTRDALELMRAVRPESGYAGLEHELMAERAASLGLAEKRVIATLAALKAAATDRPARLAAAREAVWAYFVQRELAGFRRHHDVIKMHDIPTQVLNGLGASGPAPVKGTHP